MIIKGEQIEALGVPAKGKFIVKTIEFLHENTPDFVHQKSDEQLAEYVEIMIQFCLLRNVHSERNIQRITYHVIEAGLGTHIGQQLEEALLFRGRNESDRVDSFIKKLKN